MLVYKGYITMDKLLDNKKHKVADALEAEIKSGAKLSVISAYFTMYAYQKLKTALGDIDSLRFLFVEPTFVKEVEESREFIIKKKERERGVSGNEYEIRLRNELTQSTVARECAQWIKNKVEFRSLKKSDVSRARAIHIQNTDKSSMVQGTLDFTSAGLGFSPSRTLEMNVFSDDTTATEQLLSWFDEIWSDPTMTEVVTDEVLQSMETVYKENSPEFLYFVTLYNIFKEYLEDINEDNIVKSKTGIKESLIWNKLYRFQRDGVLGAIDKLERHNGCIIADSVGLGKTFEALAVIKYYELRNDRVLVLAPKKLRDNWQMYRTNDVRNVLASDRFNYDILNHTDLTRERGQSGDINLETLNWSNYDLIVIDESHNFRNTNPRKDKKTRYSKLMEDIVQAGVKTKVLMLSATPVNNRLSDLKNQVAFITENNDHALADYGVKSIGGTLNLAQRMFNEWSELPAEQRRLDTLLQYLNVDYFKLLDTLTIARSRRHIEKYYDLTEVGKFPDRQKPKNIKSDIDIDGEFPSLEDVNATLVRIKLAVYSPLSYVLPERLGYYAKLYDIEVRPGNTFTQIDREKNIVRLMRINILKRLESSVYSYNITLNNIADRIKNTLAAADSFDESTTFEMELEDMDESLDGDDPELEAMTVGSKVQVKLSDIDLVKWRQDLEDDLRFFETLIAQATAVSPERDAKMRDLRNLIEQKQTVPLNPGNKKVIIFSAFADTTTYLYEHLSLHFKEHYGINSALVTGGGTNKVTVKTIPNDLSGILTNFSPRAKEKSKIYPNITDEIDILFATDCVSEGQNLQDCDFLVNYDIHWNPVRIIQRFGRIDRIGSINDKIQLVNFWPNMELDSYIKLEQRVRGRMMLLNTSATGEEDMINQTEADVMNDIEYRRNQLTKLQDEVVDLEDIAGTISITDLTMNDFKMDLADYMKINEAALENAPLGMFAIAPKDKLEAGFEPGIILTLKQAQFSKVESKEANALHPYYLVYISQTGEIRYSYLQGKYILDLFKKLCHGDNTVHQDLVAIFDKETNDSRNMEQYSSLLKAAISHMVGQKQEDGLQNLFGAVGKTNIAKNASLSALDDFELISFLIVK